MQPASQRSYESAWLILLLAASLFASSFEVAQSQEIKVTLSGNEEIPPVPTQASATGIITVAADKSVRGGVSVSGMTVTAAHIHEAPAGKNGPIIIPLIKTADNMWSVPEGAKFTDAQYDSYKAGNLYYNVHSAAYKGGEIRGQIRP